MVSSDSFDLPMTLNSINNRLSKGHHGKFSTVQMIVWESIQNFD